MTAYLSPGEGPVALLLDVVKARAGSIAAGAASTRSVHRDSSKRHTDRCILGQCIGVERPAAHGLSKDLNLFALILDAISADEGTMGATRDKRLVETRIAERQSGSLQK